MKTSFKKIKDKHEYAVPVMYSYINQYRRYIDVKTPERVGVPDKEFSGEHFFPYGLNKPISRVIDYTNIKEFDYDTE